MGGSDIGEGGPRGIGLTASDRGGGGAGAIDRRTIGLPVIGQDVGPATCSGVDAKAPSQISLRL